MRERKAYLIAQHQLEWHSALPIISGSLYVSEANDNDHESEAKHAREG